MSRRIAIFCFFYAFSLSAQKDSSVYLTFEQFITLVKTNHPVAMQADLQLAKGEANLLKAKGAFDPKFFQYTEAKEFNSKEYYFLSNTGLKVPTWFGIEGKVGYEANRGEYLGNEHTTPGSGLWYAGVTVPLGKNLFIDERRTTLKQAKLMIGQSEIDRAIMYNDLIVHASAAYWDWFKANQYFSAAETGVTLATQRLTAIKAGAEIGEFARMDTLEAQLFLNSRIIEKEQAFTDLAYYRSVLNTYLWLPGNVPLELEEGTLPQIRLSGLILPEEKITVDSTIWMKQYDYKIGYLDLEERLKKEMFKPQIDVSYTPLLQPTSSDLFLPFSANNMKWGVTASFPIFLRKERGDLQSIRIKQLETDYQQDTKRLELLNKIEATRVSIASLTRQIAIQETMVEAYNTLKMAEMTKFEIGESSLFLVNSREMKYLESLQKLAELQSKLMIQLANYRWLTAEQF